MGNKPIILQLLTSIDFFLCFKRTSFKDIHPFWISVISCYFDSMELISTVYWTNTLRCFFIMLANWICSPHSDKLPCLDTFYWFRDDQYFSFSSQCCMLIREAANANLLFLSYSFESTWWSYSIKRDTYLFYNLFFNPSGDQTSIYLTCCKHASHSTTNVGYSCVNNINCVGYELWEIWHLNKIRPFKICI